VENIWLYNRARDRWEHPLAENILLDTLPQIGHAEAGYFPDLSYQKWRLALGEVVMERDNVELCVNAARSIYQQLLGVEKVHPAPVIPWDELEGRLRSLFSDPGKKPTALDRSSLKAYHVFHATNLEARCRAWQQAFGDWFAGAGEPYFYDRTACRREALEGDVNWDDYNGLDWAQMLPLRSREGFWDSRWVHFHRAALHQRHFVLENLP
jgi:hypothetical protein